MPAVTPAGQLRTVVTGLLAFAAAQEQELLASRPGPESGTAARWAAAPLVAHNTEFKRQQVQRLESIRAGTTPPEFGEIDHLSDAVYQACAALPADRVARESWQATGALIDGLAASADADLLDPARHPWLRGRMLWLQIIVRGFWHPSGHLGEYYLAHGEPGRAVTLASRAVDDRGRPGRARAGPGNGQLQPGLRAGPVGPPGRSGDGADRRDHAEPGRPGQRRPGPGPGGAAGRAAGLPRCSLASPAASGQPLEVPGCGRASV